MLRPTELLHLNRPEITSFFPVERGLPLEFIANVIKPFNPTLRPIGAYKFVTDISDLGRDINQLRQRVIDPDYHNVRATASGAEAPLSREALHKGVTLKRDLKDWEVIVEAIAADLYPTADRAYYRDAVFGEAGNSLSDATEKWMHRGVRFPDATKDYPHIIRKASVTIRETRVEEEAFISSCLCYDWESLRVSGYLTNIPDAAEGVTRGAYERTMRALRLTGAKVAYAVAWRVMALRPYRLLLSDPHIKERLIIEFGPNAVEYIAMVEEMASLPVHRWLAIADSITMPGRNLTPWGAATVTFGLEGTVVGKLFGNPSYADVAVGTEPIDPITAIPWDRVFSYARAMKQELRLLREDEGLALDAAFAALRFTAVGQRPKIGLMGKERTPLHVDGTSATEAVAPLDLLFRQLAPCRLYNAEIPWVGEPTIFTLKDLESLKQGRIWIEEETLPIVGKYTLGRLSPSQLASATQWQGEDDAVFTPANLAGIAQLLGITVKELEAKIVATGADAEGWGALFKIQQEKLVAKDGAQSVYVSHRTRRLSQTEVVIPNHPLTHLHALRYGYVVRTERLSAQFVRDFDVPMASYDVSEKLRAFAVDMFSKR